MKNIAVFFVILTFVFADPRPTQEDFSACYIKNKNSIVSVNGNYGVAITPNSIAVVKTSKTKINDYIKFDPYLGLYLVRSNITLEPAVMVDETDDTKIKKSTWVGILSDNNNTLMGHIKSLGINLGDFDTLSFDSNVTGELNSACCKMIGIAIGDDKFIPNRYLKHFAAYDDVYYGDIGVVFIQNDKGFFVSSSDPVGRGKMLMVGDEILTIDSVKPTGLRDLNEKILFAPKGSFLEFKIKRDGEELKFKVPVSGNISSVKSLSIDEAKNNSTTKKNTNVVLKDLFETNKTKDEDYEDLSGGAQILKDYGIVVDKNLIVKKVLDESAAQIFGISVGDKILQIDKRQVKTKSALFDNIPMDKSFLLLFMRNDFNFFARVSK